MLKRHVFRLFLKQSKVN